MTEPKIEELMDRAESKFSLVMGAAKRTRQITDFMNALGRGELLEEGAAPPPMTEEVIKRPFQIALHEIAEGRVRIVRFTVEELAAMEEEKPITKRKVEAEEEVIKARKPKIEKKAAEEKGKKAETKLKKEKTEQKVKAEEKVKKPAAKPVIKAAKKPAAKPATKPTVKAVKAEKKATPKEKIKTTPAKKAAKKEKLTAQAKKK